MCHTQYKSILIIALRCQSHLTSDSANSAFFFLSSMKPQFAVTLCLLFLMTPRIYSYFYSEIKAGDKEGYGTIN